MSYELPLFLVGLLPADVDMSANQFQCVSLGAASAGIQGTGVGGAAIVLPSAGNAHGPVVGVLQGNPKAGQPADVMTHGISKVVAGGTFAIGDLLMYDSVSGGVILATTGNQALGVALETGSAGQTVAVLLKQYGKI